MKLVKCPICGKIKKVYASQRFFRCCSMLFEVEKYRIIDGVNLKKPLKNDEIKIEIEENPKEEDEIEVELV